MAEALSFGTDAITEYAGTKKVAEILGDNQDRKPVRILDVNGSLGVCRSQDRRRPSGNGARNGWTLPLPNAAGRKIRAPSSTSCQVILLVEDEERLRNFVTEALRDLGYTVVHASNGAQALAMIDAGQPATLLFTDIVMPAMTGRQLADAAVPRLKVLYTTGYTRNAVVHNGTLDPSTNFLAKPFGIGQLAAKVREVLDLK